MNEDEVIVSVIMPVYNEEKYIADCIESLLKQDYSIKKMEWLFIDGCSTDNTVAIIEQYKSRYPYLITYYSNPKRIVPYAMNIGIRHARGKYIIRLDAHAEYAKDYISKSIFYLETTDAD
ncbi:MAG: glycosyltransferase, partial [Lachnospiraceae bacterium]|nr:glycosyltransferase [Lachnospiraceae bacterium]